MTKAFESFREFYPYYLKEHRNLVCRRLHFIGSALVLLILIWSLISQTPGGLLLMPLVGYGFAWVGHVFFEKNRPATFKHPWYSLLADWVMFRDMLTGRIKF